jgi:hypothetical protein
VWDGGVEWNYLLVDLRNRNLEQSNKLLQLAGLLTDSNVRIRRLQRFGAVSNDVPRMMELIVSFVLRHATAHVVVSQRVQIMQLCEPIKRN